ncbi:MAG TPA: DUF4445 domain-containing protein [Planctomycetes bacterium]|mgnify:CR=1 FL=1|nr:DUF4445 domain-containing protein [Planctomycetota bacterium]
MTEKKRARNQPPPLTVTIIPQSGAAHPCVKVRANKGERLHEAIARAGIHVQAPCGGAGTCGKCRIRVVGDGAPAPSAEEKKFISAEELADGWRMACRLEIPADITVEIPAASLLPTDDGLTSGHHVRMEVEPMVAVKSVGVPSGSLEDQRCDAERLAEAAGYGVAGDVEVLKKLPGAMQRGGGRVDVLVCDDEIIDVFDSRPDRPVLGLAVDIGTTTIACELLDVSEGRMLGVTATSNPQASVGADVLSRIEYARKHSDGLSRLSSLVSETIRERLEHLLKRAGCGGGDVYEVVVAGNTIMLHLLSGIDPCAIAEVPFTPVFTESLAVSAEKLGLAVSPAGRVVTLPCVSGYVGADVVAGLGVLEAASLEDRPSLFIDIGTNGEMALLTDAAWYACSTAAGPAFEGAKISCGMRAVAGAVDTVDVEGKGLRWSTVQGRPPQGICGSGLIDAAAAFLKLGLLEPTGGIAEPASQPEELASLIGQSASGEPAIHLCPNVSITQRDIRELQLAKGAVSAGASILLREAGLTAADVQHVYVAGAFGSFIRAESAVAISIVPPGIPAQKLRFLGNTALVGAKLALASRTRRRRMTEIARSIRYIELSGRADFQAAFAEAMFFGQEGGAG